MPEFTIFQSLQQNKNIGMKGPLTIFSPPNKHIFNCCVSIDENAIKGGNFYLILAAGDNNE